ncbi:MAG: hypothetical protein AAGF11_06170 [Myxococcota bacterium]
MHTGRPSRSVTNPRAAAAAATTFGRLYAVRGDYQRPDTTKTLRQGLAEYYQVNPGLSDPGSMGDDFSAHYFRCHDTTHVIFGTHTGPLDEGVNDLFTMFGVDVSYVGYVKGFFRTSPAQAITKEYGALPTATIAGSIAGTLRLLPRIWRTCRTMRHKWPWAPPSDVLDRPIIELREEYGIEVWRPEVVLGLRRDR